MSNIVFSDPEVKLINYCGSDLTVVNAARVSFDKESSFREDGSLSEEDAGLIRYLARNKHLSPFNHAFITVRAKFSLAVARQLVKHEYMPWNEISRRYVDTDPEFYIPREIREKHENKKQGSGGVHPNSDKWVEALAKNSLYSLELYREAIKEHVCPEQARFLLPQNMMVELYWSGTLGAFAKMFSLRLPNDAQQEAREVAELIYKEVQPLFPVSLEALIGT